jgi:RNA polymerase sigma-70 factor (ECF subfamily)
MYESYEDERLMVLYLEGDEGAFRELYRRYKAKVFGFLCSKVDARTADELFQTTFMKLHRSRTMYDPHQPLAAWLFAICRNVLHDYYRQNARQVPRADTDVEMIALETQDNVSGRDLALETAIASLPEKQQSAIRMRYTDGMEFDEMAEQLGTSSGNVRQLLSRTLRTLKKKIGA